MSCIALTFDGMRYLHLRIDALPVGHAQVPIKLVGFNKTPEMEAYIIAGNIGKQIVVGLPGEYVVAMKRSNGLLVDDDLPQWYATAGIRLGDLWTSFSFGHGGSAACFRCITEVP
jgi:hypothetical protein